MKRLLSLVCVLIAPSCFAADYFVAGSGNHTAPFDNWSKAATNIQSAVDASSNGDTLFIDDGSYMLSSAISVNTTITLKSRNGRDFTIIDGNGLVPCFQLDDVNCTLSGLTITNGFNAGDGGGVVCAGGLPVITNCVLTGNQADYGGGIFKGTISHSIVQGNTALNSGGGVHSSRVSYSILSGNTAMESGGGVDSSELRNCLLYANIASNGFGGGANASDLYNCTVVANMAGGVGDAGGVDGSVIFNSIVFNNTARDAKDLDIAFNTLVEHTCSSGVDHGIAGNTTNAPSFIDLSGGNYRLQTGSPCINAGNNSYVSSVVDLDGKIRIFGGAVDMGAYEVQVSSFDMDGDLMPDAWEIQYFGSTNAMPDDLTGDNDSQNNLEEYIAGTDPTNGASFFAVTNWDVGNSILQWPSFSNREYAVFWAQSLTNGFEQLGPMIDHPQSSYTDTVHGAESAGFYKVQVQLKQ